MMNPKLPPFFGLDDVDAVGVFGDVCTNGDGTIDIQELVIWWDDNGDEDRSKKDLKRLIREFDEDNDKKLDIDEWANLVNYEVVEPDDTECGVMF